MKREISNKSPIGNEGAFLYKIKIVFHVTFIIFSPILEKV